MPKSFHHMPGPRGLPIIGSVLQYSRFGKHSFDRLHLAKLENHAKYGKIYREKLGPAASIVQLFDPRDAGHVFRADGRLPLRPPLPITVAAHKRDGFPLGLGSLNGPDWYSLRSGVQKLMMHPLAASHYLPAQNAVADDFLRLLSDKISEKDYVDDFYDTIVKYTMESIGTVCFDNRLGVLQPNLEEESIAHQMLAASQKMFRAVQNTTFAFPWYFFFRTALYKDFVEGKIGCNRVAREFVDAALAEVGTRSTEKGEKDEMVRGEDGCPHFLASLAATNKLDTDDIVGVTLDLFTAGIDSTANALSFVIYNLARNPEKQTMLAKEIRTVLPPGAESGVSVDALNNMSYLKACVKESFRLNFPVEGGTTRILDKDTVIRDYLVPKGTFVAFNNQTMCLQEEYFDQPTEYRPERWLKDGSASLKPPPRFVMLPFGYGPRMCIGRRFAEQEIYLALIKLLQHYQMEYRDSEPIGMFNRVFTMPDRPLKIHFIPR